MASCLVNPDTRKIAAVIFDLDGTLLNSREARVRAWSSAFKLRGISVPDEELRMLIGLPGESLASRYSGDPPGVEKDEEEFFLSELKDVHLFPDVEETFRELKKAGIRTSIVTSSRRSLVDRLELPTDTIVCIDDVSRGKPDPESYILAAEKMQVRKEDMLIVGDSENDMIPCSITGSICVFFRDGREMVSENSHYYIDRIAEVIDIVKKINSIHERESGK